MAFIDSMNA